MNKRQFTRFKNLRPCEVRSTKWACLNTIAALGIGNNFQLLCNNVGLQDFVLQDLPTYHRLTLEFLSTLTHTIGNYAGGGDWIRFRLMGIDYDMSLNEW
jgi:hypothetical protein